MENLSCLCFQFNPTQMCEKFWGTFRTCMLSFRNIFLFPSQTNSQNSFHLALIGQLQNCVKIIKLTSLSLYRKQLDDIICFFKLLIVLKKRSSMLYNWVRKTLLSCLPKRKIILLKQENAVNFGFPNNICFSDLATLSHVSLHLPTTRLFRSTIFLKSSAKSGCGMY